MENNISFPIEKGAFISKSKESPKKVSKKTICFATMCKNEEHCIREALESVYKYITTWVVHDTGSTDNTCKIVRDFFEEKGIPGELFIDEWHGMGYNKTLLFNKCYGRSDYILHFDADDLLIGDLNFNVNGQYDAYSLRTKRSNIFYKCSIIWNNKVHWKFCGIAHTTIKCLEKPNYTISDELAYSDCHLYSRTIGSRALDPDKYLNDALTLRTQFFNTLYDDPDNLNTRSVFYTAQSYMDAEKNEEALQWYNLYLKLKNTWNEEQYESYIRIALLLIRLKKSYEEIKKYIDKANNLFSDRAEGYFILGSYCNNINKYDIAYTLLTNAKKKVYQHALKKYRLFIRRNNYDKYINDELSLSCYWTQHYKEGKTLIEEIINDPEFKDSKTRLKTNINFFNQKVKDCEE